MSLGEVCWLVFLAGLPFAPLLERRIDLWHAHSMWAGLWIGLLFGLSIFTKEKKSTFGNKPLAAWLIFTWVWTFWAFLKGLAINKQYNMVLFMPMLHILSIGLFYLSAKTFWGRQAIERILKTIAISSSIMIAYGVSQALNFDPLFSNSYILEKRHEIVGMIGNPCHFGVYLAVILPIFWMYKNYWSYAAQAGIWGLLITMLIRNSSVSGIMTAVVASIVWMLFKNRKAAVLTGFIIFLVIIGLLIGHTHFHQIITDSGRFKAWALFSKLIGQSPMFGIGAGAVSFLSQTLKADNPLFTWRHVHNEFLQITVEQGLIGLSIAFWFIYDTVKRILTIKSNPVAPTLAGIFAAFLFSSLTVFPAHLWMIGSIVLFSVCAINVLSEE